MNNLIRTILLALENGDYRTIQEWSIGFMEVKSPYNGNPTWHLMGSDHINGDDIILRDGYRFLEPDSNIHFKTFQEAVDFYEVNMRYKIVEMVEV